MGGSRGPIGRGVKVPNGNRGVKVGFAMSLATNLAVGLAAGLVVGLAVGFTVDTTAEVAVGCHGKFHGNIGGHNRGTYRGRWDSVDLAATCRGALSQAMPQKAKHCASVQTSRGAICLRCIKKTAYCEESAYDATSV